ncbi:MAG: hydroxymethylglutaryl-CoA reductase, degradative [Bdellovibrionales bacterium]|nr:hydroxymethylglutaryl-CoA reductase, degradative [Bdellovibrionales bacterium]
MNDKMLELFQGFSKLTREERFSRLQKMGALSAEDIKYLKSGGLKDTKLAEKFVENVIGYFQIPLGVATNFVIDNQAYVIPMAVEETSIIAAASKTAKWIREHGSIRTEILGKNIIGQIQVAKVSDFEKFEKIILENKQNFINEVNREVAFGLVKRGGGVMDIRIRRVSRSDVENMGDMAVVHVEADACDAMGANIMNQVCEYLKAPIEALTGEKVTMCILSNLVDTRLTKATVTMTGIEAELMNRIVEASLFAQQDPYRAATNNKGVLNGIDPILIATGNDWRAVEAGVHAFAARDGRYRSMTQWYRRGDSLVGELVAPIVLGVVGGVTKLHPTATMALRMLSVSSAEELSRICAAVGLVQNLGALRALTTVGIIEGHMKLHIKNLTIGAGASEKESPIVQKKLEEFLSLHKRISLSNAIDILRDLRSSSGASTLTPNEQR